MQGVAAAWLMTSLTTSPLPVALLTTMASLPLFLLGLPAGALADVVDRRWLVLATQFWMLVVAAVLGGLSVVGIMTPWLLLLFTFLLGVGAALSAPAWQAIVPQLVDRSDLAAAVAVNSAGFNLARAVGPALGGLLIAAAGPAWVFFLNAVSFVAVIVVIHRWRPEPAPAISETSAAPAEQVGSAVAAGARFARHWPPLRAVLARTSAFIIPASALWALLPVVADQRLGLSAMGYGVLLGSIGAGAVAGTTLMPRLRSRFSPGQLVAGCSLVYAAAMAGLAFVQNLILVNAMLVAVGVAWLIITSLLNVTAQTTTPAWVEARALGVYILVFQGGFAGGSAAWGVVAGQLGTNTALIAAGAFMAVGIVTALRWKLEIGEEMDLTPSQHWPEPEVAVEPHAEAGPVLVTVEYRIPLGRQAAFCDVTQGLQLVRLRDGATQWGLFRDTADPERLVETFVVASWAEHLRQHTRMTVTDREIEEQALALQRPGTEPVITYMVSANCMLEHNEPPRLREVG